MIQPLSADPLLLGPIPESLPAKARWDVAITANGVEVIIDPFAAGYELDKKKPHLAIVDPGGKITPVTTIDQLRMFNPGYGEWGYGLEPSGGFAQPYVREPGGGGVVVIPYCMVHGELYIGVTWVDYLLDDRYNKVLGVPRKFLNDKAQALESAKNAAGEKMVVSANLFEERGEGKFQIRLHTIDAEPFNCNNRFFIRDRSKGEGIKVFGAEFLYIPLKVDCLQQNPEDTTIKISPNMIAIFGEKSPEAKALAPIMGADFIHYTRISNLGDAMSSTATDQLLGHMRRSEMKYLAKTDLVRKMVEDPKSRAILEELLKAQRDRNA